MNYALRIQKIRAEMERRGVKGLFVANDAGWEYFTGLPRGGHDNTKQRQNSAEFGGLLITGQKVTAFSPRLSALSFSGRMEQFPEVDELVIYQDPDITGKTFESELRAQGLAGAAVAVNRDISSTMTLRLQDSLGCRVCDMSAEIDALRAVKDPDEIALMRKASQTADDIYQAILPMIRPGNKVRDIEHEIERLLETMGCSYTSFGAEVLNHGPKAGVGVGAGYHTLQSDHTVAFDYGTVYQGYCSDFGRTLFLQEPGAELRRYHELVMAAQKAGMEAMKAGKATGADCNAAARAVIEDAGLGEYFIHRLGHGIGKDVHERPFLTLGETTVLQPGMCFTAEPSLYIPHKCLIRVEDVVLVTADGYECLNTTSKDIVVLG